MSSSIHASAGRLRLLRLRRVTLAHLPDLLFWVLLVLHALPVWLLTYFPTQDGPAHVENVMALLRRSEVDVLAAHLGSNWGLQPNWATQALFAALASIVSPLGAQRLVLTGYLILLPLAARFALPRTRRGRWATLAVFPFLYSFPFHMGFWNFGYGLVLVLAVAGVWRRARGRVDARRLALLSGLLLAAYFCHAVAVSASLVLLAVLLGWRTATGLARARRRPSRQALVLRAMALRTAGVMAAAAPALVLLGTFLARNQAHATAREPVLALAGKLVSLYALVSIDRREILLSLPVALALLAGVIRRLLRRRTERGVRARPVDAWLAAAAAFVVLYFAVPDVMASGAQISHRLALLPFLMVVLWLGTAAGPARDVRRVALAVALLSVAALALRAPRWRALDHDLAEYASVLGAVERGSVVLPITLAPYGLAPDGGRLAWRVRVFQHAAGYAAAERDALDLDDSQANTAHAPVRLAPGPNPFRDLGAGPGLEGDPPCVDLAAWRRAGGRLDAVIVFGATPLTAAAGCARATLSVLASSEYERVAVSRPRGLVEVYRPAAAPTAAARREVESGPGR